jgi:hypothetical protein
MHWTARLPAAAVAALLGVLATVAFDRLAPAPAADVARGSEDAFASGLELREFSGPQRSPSRWTSGSSRFRFENLPPGPRTLEVACRGHRNAVVVAVDGVIVGSLAPGSHRLEIALPPGPRRLAVALEVEPFVAGDRRRLGTLLDRVALRVDASGAPAPALALAFSGLAAGGAIAASLAGFGPFAAGTLGTSLVAANGILLWPEGLIRSPYATALPLWLALGCAGSLAFARWRSRRAPGSARWAFAAALAAFLVQGVLASAPNMVVSDAVFHANKLGAVAGGNLFPVSETQHERPFRFPYGFAFYALLSPGLWAGGDAVDLVRWGASASGVAGSLALYLLAEPVSAAVAGSSTILLQLLPGTFDIHSFGNLSNVFGQAVTTLFLAWWLPRRGGAAAGALLLVAACLSHLSSLIVCTVLVAALLIAFRSRVARVHLVALGVAAVVCLAYYSRFLPLVMEQLPRLREGGGPGDERLSALVVLALQGEAIVRQWGFPAIALAAAGLVASLRGDLGRVLAALWGAGGALAALALVSPLEVRFVYALAPAIAVACARGAERLLSGGLAGRLGAVVALAALLALGVSNIAEAIVHRYRL